MKKYWKYIKWACKFRETPNENELYGKKLHDRCFYDGNSWDDATVCRLKKCPLLT